MTAPGHCHCRTTASAGFEVRGGRANIPALVLAVLEYDLDSHGLRTHGELPLHTRYSVHRFRTSYGIFSQGALNQLWKLQRFMQPFPLCCKPSKSARNKHRHEQRWGELFDRRTLWFLAKQQQCDSLLFRRQLHTSDSSFNTSGCLGA